MVVSSLVKKEKIESGVSIRTNYTILYNSLKQKENRRESALWAYLVDSCILLLPINALTG